MSAQIFEFPQNGANAVVDQQSSAEALSGVVNRLPWVRQQVGRAVSSLGKLEPVTAPDFRVVPRPMSDERQMVQPVYGRTRKAEALFVDVMHARRLMEHTGDLTQAAELSVFYAFGLGVVSNGIHKVNPRRAGSLAKEDLNTGLWPGEFVFPGAEGRLLPHRLAGTIALRAAGLPLTALSSAAPDELPLTSHEAALLNPLPPLQAREMYEVLKTGSQPI